MVSLKHKITTELVCVNETKYADDVSGGPAHQNSPSSSTFSPSLFFSFLGISLHSLDLRKGAGGKEGRGGER